MTLGRGTLVYGVRLMTACVLFAVGVNAQAPSNQPRDQKPQLSEDAFKNVRVNAVQPGLVRTAMTEAMPERIWNEKLAEIPMGRAAEPSEVASVVLFLASDLSSYMTGTVLEITGGRHI